MNMNKILKYGVVAASVCVGCASSVAAPTCHEGSLKVLVKDWAAKTRIVHTENSYKTANDGIAGNTQLPGDAGGVAMINKMLGPDKDTISTWPCLDLYGRTFVSYLINQGDKLKDNSLKGLADAVAALNGGIDDSAHDISLAALCNYIGKSVHVYSSLYTSRGKETPITKKLKEKTGNNVKIIAYRRIGVTDEATFENSLANLKQNYGGAGNTICQPVNQAVLQACHLYGGKWSDLQLNGANAFDNKGYLTEDSAKYLQGLANVEAMSKAVIDAILNLVGQNARLNEDDSLTSLMDAGAIRDILIIGGDTDVKSSQEYKDLQKSYDELTAQCDTVADVAYNLGYDINYTNGTIMKLL